jgi:hypothetical protein
MDSALTYLVMTISGAATIDDTAFGLTGVIASPPAPVQVAETLCTGRVLVRTGKVSRCG